MSARLKPARSSKRREIGEVVAVLRQHGRRRDEVLPYFAEKDHEVAGAEYDQQLVAEPTAPPGTTVH
jgi:hypothetical protein